jgi:phosphopantetheinyl transferase
VSLFFQQNINETSRLAIWQIEEREEFFYIKVPLHREITHPHKRLQHLAGRYLLPCLFPDFPHEQIEVADTRKPFLPNEQYHFSISHCGNYAAAIASSSARVGVDVELFTPRIEKIKHKFLHVEEIGFVHEQPKDVHIKYLTLLWSAKEAMYKWYGLGEVDFSSMMRTDPFEINSETIKAAFIKDDFKKNLTLHYRVFDEACLVWVMDNV